MKKYDIYLPAKSQKYDVFAGLNHSSFDVFMKKCVISCDIAVNAIPIKAMRLRMLSEADNLSFSDIDSMLLTDFDYVITEE